MRFFKLAFLPGVAIVVLFSSGCMSSAHSPPTRQVLNESVETAKVGTVPVRASAFTAADSDILGGFEVAGGEISARTGLSENMETSLTTGLMKINGSDGADVDVDPRIWTMRAGLKYNPEATRSFLSFVAGAGTGYSAGGFFAGPDLGFVLGYENTALVPFLAVGSMISIPISPNEVNLVDKHEHEHDVEPWTSLTTSAAIGMKLPLESIGVNIIAVFPQISDIRKIGDEETDDTYQTRDTLVAASLSVEAVFGKP